MKDVGLPAKRVASTDLGRMLVLLFALTIGSLLLSRGLSDYRARGIDAAASNITSVAAPAIEHLSKTRTELRHMDALLSNFLSRSAAHQNVDVARSELDASRAEFEREWNAYLSLPPYPTEPRLWAVAVEERRFMNQSIDTVVLRAEKGDTKRATAERDNRTGPSVDRMDGDLLRAINLNAENAARQGEHIEAIRGKVRLWGMLLDGLIIVFGAGALFLVLRVNRRFTQLMDLRVSELELFAGRVAHDIRSPLTAVGFVLDMAKRDPGLDPKMAGMVDRGIRSLQRVGQVIDALLVFARSGGRRAEQAHVDVKGIVTDLVEDMRPAAEEKGIDLKLDPEGPSSMVACSPGVLVSIVSNLLGNAIKYMGDEPIKQITVRYSTSGKMARVEVHDTGPGVPPELRERIFDPYVRATHSTIPGIGLGLATVRRLTESHGGSVGMAPNEGVGGSIFWIELPLALHDARSLAEKARAAQIPRAEQAHVANLERSEKANP